MQAVEHPAGWRTFELNTDWLASITSSAYLTQMGLVPVTGTRSEAHMREDLSIFDFELTAGQKTLTRNGTMSLP
jgi:hypothetical protein